MTDEGHDSFIGQKVAGFLVREKLGEGGMGSVYLAWQTRLNRAVALKVLPGALSFASPRVLKRFIREARAAASISHTNVVQIFDAGSDADVNYIAMEYVEGVGLNVLLKKYDAFTEPEALMIAIQAARGLKAAADNDIVHRDIKPGNLMIAKDGCVKVADFGLAKDFTTNAAITAEGHVIGTPPYMSPEQCTGKDLDFRSDMYSLGVTLFEMATGRRPFISSSSLGMLRMHCTDPVPDMLALNPKLSPRLVTVVNRLLAKDPADRYPDYNALLAELESLKVELTRDTMLAAREPTPPTARRVPIPPPDRDEVPTKRMDEMSESTLMRLVRAIPREVMGIDALRERIEGEAKLVAVVEGGDPPRAEDEGKGEPQSLLRLEEVTASYGRIEVLHSIDLTVGEGEIVTLIGANGAGKSTVLNTICGLVRASAGAIWFAETDISTVPAAAIAALGVAQVPEGRRLFPDMTVLENLEMGAYLRKDRSAIEADLDRAFAYFPILKERLRQLAGSLSGGEQQMCAIARGLMARPRILLLDEPSLGLAPILVEQIFDIIRTLNSEGATILLVEQNARMALRVAHHAYVLETGTVRLHGLASRLAENEEVRRAYLGGH